MKQEKLSVVPYMHCIESSLMHGANNTHVTNRETAETHCFGRHNRIKVIKASESAWIVSFKVVDDSFLYNADWVVGLPACKHGLALWHAAKLLRCTALQLLDVFI